MPALFFVYVKVLLLIVVFFWDQSHLSTLWDDRNLFSFFFAVVSGSFAMLLGLAASLSAFAYDTICIHVIFVCTVQYCCYYCYYCYHWYCWEFFIHIQLPTKMLLTINSLLCLVLLLLLLLFCLSNKKHVLFLVSFAGLLSRPFHLYLTPFSHLSTTSLHFPRSLSLSFSRSNTMSLFISHVLFVCCIEYQYLLFNDELLLLLPCLIFDALRFISVKHTFENICMCERERERESEIVLFILFIFYFVSYRFAGSLTWLFNKKRKETNE